MICLGVDLFRFILFGIPCASCTWMCVSFFRFGEISDIISSNTFSTLLSLSSPSGIPIVCRLACFILSHRSHMLLSFFFFFICLLSAVLIGWVLLFYLPDHLFGLLHYLVCHLLCLAWFSCWQLSCLIFICSCLWFLALHCSDLHFYWESFLIPSAFL